MCIQQTSIKLHTIQTQKNIIQACLYDNSLKMTFIYNISAHYHFILQCRKYGANNIYLAFQFFIKQCISEFNQSLTNMEQIAHFA
jgi:hypothetical protein